MDEKKEERRLDPRSEQTRAALIDEAEMLFAKSGIDGVSLRQIGAAIGAGNTNVVRYHFGTKDRLVIEIFRLRLAHIDARRADLLSQLAERKATSDVITLLDVLCRPFLEQVDRNGRHSFAAFVDGVIRSGRLPLRSLVAPEFKTTNDISERIAIACGKQAGDPDFLLRLHLSLSILLAALQVIDQDIGRDGSQREVLFTDAIKMMAGALLAGA